MKEIRRSWILLLSASAAAVLAVFLLRAGWVQGAAPRAAPPSPNGVADLAAIIAAAGRGPMTAQQGDSYSLVSDEWEFSSMEVPTDWKDTDTGPWLVDSREIGVFISAAPDLSAFEVGTGPGVFFGLTKEGTPAQPVTEQPEAAVRELAARRVEKEGQRYIACLRQGIQAYHDPYLSGAYDVVSKCRFDGGRTQRVLLDAMPLSQNYRVELRIVTMDGQDRAAVAHILRTLQVMNPSMINPHSDEHEN